MKVVDTTFLIDVLQGKKEVTKFFLSDEILLTTQINMFEVIRGLFLRNISPKKYLEVIEMFDQIRVLPLDDDGIVKASQISAVLLKKGQEISDNDCLIAGISMSKGFKTIITKNKKHFNRIEGLCVEDY